MRPSRWLTDTGLLRIESGGNISFVHSDVKQLLMWLRRASRGLGKVNTALLAENSSCCSWDSQQLKRSCVGRWICPGPISSTNQEIILSNLALFQSTSNVLFTGLQNWARPIQIPLFTWPSRGVSLMAFAVFKRQETDAIVFSTLRLLYSRPGIEISGLIWGSLPRNLCHMGKEQLGRPAVPGSELYPACKFSGLCLPV